MSKIHYFQRYSSVENTVTNNTLQLIARIYSYSPLQASKLLSELADENIEIGIAINQQQRVKDSVPDGTISQESFKVLIESKVDSGVDKGQLIRHAANFKQESQKILLLLTKESISDNLTAEIQQEISAKYSSAEIIFKNVTYENICAAINNLFKDFELEMRSIIDDYIEYCNDVGLTDQSKNLLRIVPCGKSVALNIKYGIYFHPSERGYVSHSYIGIYNKKAVQAIWKIDSVFDVSFDGVTLNKDLIQGRQTDDYDETIKSMIHEAKEICNYEIQYGTRFFCGKAQTTNFVKTSFGGMQNARYFNLKDILGEFEDTKDAATKLNGKTWQ